MQNLVFKRNCYS